MASAKQLVKSLEQYWISGVRWYQPTTIFLVCNLALKSQINFIVKSGGELLDDEAKCLASMFSLYLEYVYIIRM